jgi:two-component system, cell cycle sensor histidine kinase and response regulator CckA
VKADRGQLEQVVMLSVNARDAMPGGGELLIETSELPRRPAGDAERPVVRLSVSDTGTGMTQDVADRAFEPFFSTKAKGDGTGLGLATVYGIVTQAGGRVSIRSTPGSGTTVRVDLPSTTDPQSPPRAAGPDLLRPANGETVLLVEDEATVRVPAQRILQRHGYVVLPAGTADEAIAVAETHDGPIDLLLTDVVMPGRSGKDLAVDIARRRPGTKVLFTSGYSQDVIAHQGLLEAGVNLLPKPSTAHDLLRKVRDVLDGR